MSGPDHQVWALVAQEPGVDGLEATGLVGGGSSGHRIALRTGGRDGGFACRSKLDQVVVFNGPFCYHFSLDESWIKLGIWHLWIMMLIVY